MSQTNRARRGHGARVSPPAASNKCNRDPENSNAVESSHIAAGEDTRAPWPEGPFRFATAANFEFHPEDEAKPNPFNPCGRVPSTLRIHGIGCGEARGHP